MMLIVKRNKHQISLWIDYTVLHAVCWLPPQLSLSVRVILYVITFSCHTSYQSPQRNEKLIFFY